MAVVVVLDDEQVRYAAVGDSFTEGIGDDVGPDTVRGWADLVAAGLAADAGEPIEYANLAVRGRLLEPIVTEQVPAALSLTPPPTLMTFNGGGNDMMRPGIDLDRVVSLTERAVQQILDAGAHLVLLAGADPSARLPFGHVIHRRGAALTAAAAELAGRYDVTFVDVFTDAEIRRPAYWSADRLHLGPHGHRRVASLVLAALGHLVTAHAIDPAPAAPRRLRDEARYFGEHVLPWVNRHLRGRSSGDGRAGKHPEWVRVDPVPLPSAGGRG